MAAKQKLDQKSEASNDPYANGLMSGQQWNTELFNADGTEELSFSFMEGPINGKAKGKSFDAWEIDEIGAIIKIFASVENITDLEFQIRGLDLDGDNDFDANDAAVLTAYDDNFGFNLDYSAITYAGVSISIVEEKAVSAEIRFFKQDLNGAEGYASYPGSGSGGDVYFDTGTLDRPDTGIVGITVEEYNDLLFYHEIGHALGLQHTFDKGRLGPMPEEYFNTGDNVDPETGSVMSYDGWYTPDLWYADPTWTEYDVSALQSMYGVAEIMPMA